MESTRRSVLAALCGAVAPIQPAPAADASFTLRAVLPVNLEPWEFELVRYIETAPDYPPFSKEAIAQEAAEEVRFGERAANYLLGLRALRGAMRFTRALRAEVSRCR